jgi:hypothetical protein
MNKLSDSIITELGLAFHGRDVAKIRVILRGMRPIGSTSAAIFFINERKTIQKNVCFLPESPPKAPIYGTAV